MGKPNLLIIGAGGHGRVVKEVAEATQQYENISFVDDRDETAIAKTDDLEKLFREENHAFVGIGNNELRSQLLRRLKEIGYSIPTLIHPKAYVSPSAQIGRGSVVTPGVIVNSNAVIGEGCILSAGAIVEHDASIGAYAHINTGAICKAGSKVDACTKIDAGQIVLGY